MNKTRIQNLLKKINFLEAEIEIQKQILFAIPSDNTEEMEHTIRGIAEKKKKIEQLREQIRETDPEEYNKILVFEDVLQQFKQLAEEKGFQHIEGGNNAEQCSLNLKDGSQVDCLIKAADSKGDWTIITMDGEIQQFDEKLVADKPDLQPLQ